MINEIAEVKGYLSGNHIVKSNLYRICYLLAKWFKEQGLSRLEIRDSIFDWGKRYNVYIRYDVNQIINKALMDKHRLKDYTVRVNDADIAEINRRFDNTKTKLVALAILCYAKAYADHDKEFTVSAVALGAWLGIHNSSVKRKYINELIDYGYISIVSTPNNTYFWEVSESDKCCRYRINVSINNDGNLILFDNDILSLYKKIFS